MQNAYKLDQFYTKPEVAKHCINVVKKLIPLKSRKVYLEPSAGSGSFSIQLKKVLSFDIDPQGPNIVRADFLSISSNKMPFPKDQVCTIGNPPFGWRASLAIKFFNHASSMSHTIAFIVPKTFRKISVQNRLNLNFWLIHDEDLPKDSFTHKGEPHNTLCCFQVWIRKPQIRVTNSVRKNDHIQFVKKQNCHFAVQRVGSKAGQVLKTVDNLSVQTHYFIENISKTYSNKELIDFLRSIDFSRISNHTAGVRSISRTEIIEELNKLLDL